MPTVSLTLIGKPGCHLCDNARDVISGVLESIRSQQDAPTVTLEERSILDDSTLFDEYAEEIPVVLINGAMHSYWRVDPTRLTTAIEEHR